MNLRRILHTVLLSGMGAGASWLLYEGIEHAVARVVLPFWMFVALTYWVAYTGEMK